MFPAASARFHEFQKILTSHRRIRGTVVETGLHRVFISSLVPRFSLPIPARWFLEALQSGRRTKLQHSAYYAVTVRSSVVATHDYTYPVLIRWSQALDGLLDLGLAGARTIHPRAGCSGAENSSNGQRWGTAPAPSDECRRPPVSPFSDSKHS
jgi:hypothetical protein